VEGRCRQGCQDHCSWWRESPVQIRCLHGVQIVQHWTPYCIWSWALGWLRPHVDMYKQVDQLSSPVHGLHLDLNDFGLVSPDDMIHCIDKTSQTDCDSIPRLDVSGIHRVFVGADLVGVNYACRVDWHYFWPVSRFYREPLWFWTAGCLNGLWISQI